MTTLKKNIHSIFIKLFVKLVFLRKLYTLLFCVAHPNYWQDRLITAQRPDEFLKDKNFIKAFQKGWETGSWQVGDIHWRIHVMLWAASIGAGVDGDFIECGVYRGGFAKAIMSFTDFNNKKKTYYLCDTFDGGEGANLFTEEEKKSRSFYGAYENTFEFVKKIFAEDNAVIVKGLVPDSLKELKLKKIAFILLDMNSAVAEEGALEFLWDKLSNGGVILFDDHSFVGYEQSAKFHLDFAEKKGQKLLCLPTGQGMIIKTS